MPIDWDEADKVIDEAVKKAAAKTDEKLAREMSSLTRLTADEIIELFPEPADVEKLKNLMKIVKAAEDQNTKVINIVGNIEDFAGIIVTLLGKLA